MIKHPLLLCALLSVTLQVAALTPTPEQIEQFKRLSPDEQKKLAESLGVTIPAGAVTGQKAKASIPAPEVVAPREADLSGESAYSKASNDTFENNVDEEVAIDGLGRVQRTPKNKEDRPQKSQASILKKEQDASLQSEQDESFTDSYESGIGKNKKKKVLQQFGYGLFAGSPSTFAPATHIPVPVDYVVGPADTLIVSLYGKENSTNEITVDRDGMLDFPSFGPVSASGLKFDELKNKIQQLVAEKMIGVQVSVSMGALRSIQVFVLGEAYKPGAYTVSSLSTMTNALFVTGGVTKVGSLRSIQLKRKGELVSTLDLYDLLLKGDTSQDVRVQPGDVLFIPPIGETVGVSGEVRRPAIYELKTEETADELITLAGGFLPTAYPKASRIDRINEKGDRTFVDANLAERKGRDTLLRNGDVLQVYSVLDKVEDAVLVTGHVNRTGGFSWKPGLRVSDVIPSVADLQPNPDLNFALIQREVGAKRLVQVLRVDLASALSGKKGAADLGLKPRDELIVLGLDENRAETLKKIVATIKSQAAIGEYAKVVRVKGNVRFPGKYPLVENMTVRDLIALAAGLKPETDLNYAVLAYRKGASGAVDIQNIRLGLGGDLNRALKADDELVIFHQNKERHTLLKEVMSQLTRQTTKQIDQKIVRISGRVRFPGVYPAMNQLKVSDLIKMAGGLKDDAFSLEAEVTRPKVVYNQAKKEEEYMVDHFPVNLVQLDQADVVLRPRDELVVKRIPHWKTETKVEIKGEVLFPGVYPVRNGEKLSEVVKRAGGLTQFADVKAAVFLRKSLAEREEEMLKTFRARLKTDVARLEAKSAAISGADQVAKAQAAGAGLLEKMDTVKSSGRLVISLDDILKHHQSVEDIVLKNGDQLVVPAVQQEISILGEVNHPTSYMYAKKHSGFDYVKMGGGITRLGDKKRSYILRRDGSVAPLAKRFLFFKYSARIEPGDTIIVPVDADIISPLTYWTSISQVLFQLATTAAALKTVGGI